MIEQAETERAKHPKIKNKNEFNKNDIHTIIGIPNPINKPNCAWWGSPKDAEFGWKEWCFCQEFEIDGYDWENPIEWTLDKNSKVLKIDWDDIKDEDNSILKPYLFHDPNFKGCWSRLCFYLDFNSMLDDGISAVQLMDGRIGHSFGFLDNPYETMFNTWDCESIVVLDDSKIKFIKKER